MPMPMPIRLSFFFNFVTNYNNFQRFSKEIATFSFGRMFGVKIQQSHIFLCTFSYSFSSSSTMQTFAVHSISTNEEMEKKLTLANQI